MIERGDWQVSDIARAAFDLEGKVVGRSPHALVQYAALQLISLQPV